MRPVRSEMCARFSATWSGRCASKLQEHSRRATEGWRRQGLDMDIAALTYPGEHTDVAAHLRAHGWDATTATLADLFAILRPGCWN